jgi:nucleotide-binding universal stress UspA family protein
MGTRGRGGLQAFALGSVASRVAHGSKIPTILVRQNTRLPEEFGRRERVLVAVDGSQQAVNAAARLASWSDWLGTIAADVAHVHEQLTVLDAILPPHDDVLEQWSGRESEEATRGARNVFAATDIRHDVHGATGEPAARIARLAEELASDLIVMGTRGRGVAHHAFIGSVALKVAKLSPVPVALVP